MVTPAVAVALASVTHPHPLQPRLPPTSRLDTYWNNNWNNTRTNISNINKSITRINNNNNNNNNNNTSNSN
jgi:hypothetical protein